MNLDLDAFVSGKSQMGVAKSTAHDWDALVFPKFHFKPIPFAFNTPILFQT